MSKTNLDDLDLATAGIEADEINTESATAGQVLTADGEGGAAFDPSSSLLRAWHGTEDRFNSGAWLDVEYGDVEVEGPGYTVNTSTGEITIGPELAGKYLQFNVKQGMWNASQNGYFKAQLRFKASGSSTWYTMAEEQIAVVASGNADAVRIITARASGVGDIWAVRTYLNLTPSGTGDWALESSSMEILAI